MNDLIRAVWNYRHFIVSSVKNDLRARFARSRFGAVWIILQPLAQVAIFALVLSEVLAAKLPGIESKNAYAVYLMSGMLAWALFLEIVTRCLGVFVENASLLKKIVFPRMCLPIIVLGTALVNNVLLMLATLLIFVAMSHAITISTLWLPGLMILTMAFALGLGLFLGVLNVFLRDISQVMTVVLQLWFWLTPVVYMSSIVPEKFKPLLAINPMYPIVTAYQQVLLFGKEPSISGLVWVGVLSLVLLALAFLIFRRAAPDMVDVL